MKKTKVTIAEAQRHFTEKKDVTQPQVEEVNMVVPSTAIGTFLEGDFFVNVHGVALDSDAMITDDGADAQFTPDENGDIYQERVAFSQLDAFYQKGVVFIEGFRYTGNTNN